MLGVGFIRKLKNKKAFNYDCANKRGLLKIAKLIHHKLRNPNRISQFNTRLIDKLGLQPTKQSNVCLKHNHWLAGFVQAKFSN